MKKVFVITALVLTAVVSMSLAVTACEVSTASLSNVKVCDKLENDTCPSDMATMATTTSAFYVTGDVNNAPTGTKIKIDWKYLGGEIAAQDIDSVTLTTEENTNVLESSLDKPDSGWPKGDYEIVLKIQTDNTDPISKKFSVK